MYDTSSLYEDCDNIAQKIRTAQEYTEIIERQVEELNKKNRYIKLGSVLMMGGGFFGAFMGGIAILNPLVFLVILVGGIFAFVSGSGDNDDKIYVKNGMLHSIRLDTIRFYMYEKVQKAERENRNQRERNQRERNQRERGQERGQESYDYFGGFGSGINRDKYSSNSTGQRGTFKDCITVKDVKKVYRTKAKKHHPDVGGDAETFKTLVIQYERALEIAQRSA